MNDKENAKEIMQTAIGQKRSKQEAIDALRNYPNVSQKDIRLILEEIWKCYSQTVPEEEYLINELLQFAKAICPK